MGSYSDGDRQKIINLRRGGFTYAEIYDALGIKISKSTVSRICRDVQLETAQQQLLATKIKMARDKNRAKALSANKLLLNNKIRAIKEANLYLQEYMFQKEAKLIALAMLYLGEGAKWNRRRGLLLANSDPMIIQMYINLLEQCYRIPKINMKARIQHRADQDSALLVDFWSTYTGIPLSNFYPCYIDKRTQGKATTKKDYKGVCSIMCPGTHIQLELEQIAGIINQALRGYGAVG